MQAKQIEEKMKSITQLIGYGPLFYDDMNFKNKVQYRHTRPESNIAYKLASDMPPVALSNSHFFTNLIICNLVSLLEKLFSKEENRLLFKWKHFEIQ